MAELLEKHFLRQQLKPAAPLSPPDCPQLRAPAYFFLTLPSPETIPSSGAPTSVRPSFCASYCTRLLGSELAALFWRFSSRESAPYPDPDQPQEPRSRFWIFIRYIFMTSNGLLLSASLTRSFFKAQLSHLLCKASPFSVWVKWTFLCHPTVLCFIIIAIYVHLAIYILH